MSNDFHFPTVTVIFPDGVQQESYIAAYTTDGLALVPVRIQMNERHRTSDKVPLVDEKGKPKTIISNVTIPLCQTGAAYQGAVDQAVASRKEPPREALQAAHLVALMPGALCPHCAAAPTPTAAFVKQKASAG